MATAENVEIKQDIFQPISADDDSQMPTEMESLCVNCEQNGITRLLLTKIPFYKEVILMSFHCDHCGYRNNEIQSGGKCQEQGIRYVVKIQNAKDLNRQIVKSEYAGISIPEIDFEIPQGSQAGEITNVEGIIRRVIDALKYGQNSRKAESSTKFEQVNTFVQKLESLLRLEMNFTLILDDPSGNSCVENPTPFQVDQNVKIIHYHRTFLQDKALALVADDAEEPPEDAAPVWDSTDAIRNEVLQFHVNCSNCRAPADTNMKFVNIPYFKEVVIMATVCSECGHRSSEVKCGGGFSEKGMRIKLNMKTVEDLSRDILKSETCSISIPELELDVGMGILGGRFTTVEGLLTSIKDEIMENGSFLRGDSADEMNREKLATFMQKLQEVIELKFPAHLILDDSAGNSYIQSLTAPAPDKQLTIEYYERTFEQNEELGLNDMKTENYYEEESVKT